MGHTYLSPEQWVPFMFTLALNVPGSKDHYLLFSSATVKKDNVSFRTHLRILWLGV